MVRGITDGSKGDTSAMESEIDVMGRRKCRPALGTFVEIVFESQMASLAVCDEIIEVGFEKINLIHRQMSFQHSSSELSNINRLALQQPVSISAEIAAVVQASLALSQQTDGLFDISIGADLVRYGVLPDHQGRSNSYDPCANWTDIELNLPDPRKASANSEGASIRFHKAMCLDLSGIAKGYAVDCAFDAMFDRAINLGVEPQQIIVNAGGDLRQLFWKDKEISVRVPIGFRGVRYDKHIMQGPAMAVSIVGHGHQAGEIVNPKTNTVLNKGFWSGVKRAASPTVIIAYDNQCMMADAKTKIKSLS